MVNNRQRVKSYKFHLASCYLNDQTSPDVVVHYPSLEPTSEVAAVMDIRNSVVEPDIERGRGEHHES